MRPPVKISCTVISPLVLFLLTLLFPDAALAHRVVIFGWIEGNTIFTESQYSDGKRVTGGAVTVYDKDGKALAQGYTNDRGEYSLAVPKTCDLRIVLNAGMGHQGEWRFSEAEVRAAASGVENAEPADLPASSPSATGSTAPHAGADAPPVDEKRMEEMVARVLDKKLQPIHRMLAEMRQQGPTATDIFGGIGYIFGLAGVAAYVLSKKNRSGK